MSTLGIENLQKIVQTGDTGALFGAGGVNGSPGAPAWEGSASNVRVEQEMRANGMEAPAPGAPGGAEGATFSGILRESVEKVNAMQQQADHAIKELVSGRTKNIHETMLTIERADTSLKLMMQVRNKILDAYREIMRMQV
jgi:flagellar hook-basal body complex protein FliE